MQINCNIQLLNDTFDLFHLFNADRASKSSQKVKAEIIDANLPLIVTQIELVGQVISKDDCFCINLCKKIYGNSFAIIFHWWFICHFYILADERWGSFRMDVCELSAIEYHFFLLFKNDFMVFQIQLRLYGSNRRNLRTILFLK